MGCRQPRSHPAPGFFVRPSVWVRGLRGRERGCRTPRFRRAHPILRSELLRILIDPRLSGLSVRGATKVR